MSPEPFVTLSKYISLFMLPVTIHGERGPLLVMLHWLSGSAQTWTEVSERLSTYDIVCATLDLPGFGHAADIDDSDVEATAEAIIESVTSLRSVSKLPWFLVGHSMGGKLAAIVARAALDGRPGLDDLRGLILISPSPPSPEPMEEATRQQMIASLGSSTRNAGEDCHRAEKFVDNNTGKLALDTKVRTRTVNDVLRMNRAAFIAWLTAGSKEDWSAKVGVLDLPALILAGTEEPALGPEAQRQLTMPHLPNATLVALKGGGHLGPLERPTEVSDRIAAFLQTLGFSTMQSAPLSADIQALIESDWTSPQTRSVLLQRLADDRATGVDGILFFEELLILRAMAGRILPGCPFDLATRVQSWLSLNTHDGWRHDSLPPDVEAWRIGLNNLNDAALRGHGVPFFALDIDHQDALLSKVCDGKLDNGAFRSVILHKDATYFSATQMRDWFGDVCAELTKFYIADPRIMQRIGFTGFADEGGFTQIRLDEREEFEL